MPGGFGEFEIEALDDSTHGDSICGLVGYDWHTHDDPLQIVLDVFAGKCLLIDEYPPGKIEEQPPGKYPKKYVTYDLAEFLEALPRGATYKVYNATEEELDRRSQPSIQDVDLNELSDVVQVSSDPAVEPNSLSGTKRLPAALVLGLIVLLTSLAIFISRW